MNTTAPQKVLELTKQIEAVPSKLRLQALAEMVRSAGIEFGDVSYSATESNESYTRNTIYRSEKVEVMLLVWKPGQSSPVHDHSGSVCAVQVLEGVASETTFEFDKQGSTRPIGFSRHEAGTVFAGEGEDMHAVANAEGRTLYTLHVYTPPLTDMNIWPDEDDLPTLSCEESRRLWQTVDYPTDTNGRYRPDWLQKRIRAEDVLEVPPSRQPDLRDRVSERLKKAGGFGRVLDRYVTLVSGIAPSDAEPWMMWTRPRLYGVILAWLFGGAAASMAIVASGHMLLLPLLAVTLFATACGARAGMLTIMHDAIHMWAEHEDSRIRRLFWWIGTLMSVLLFVEDFPTYARKHLQHHGDEFATPDDPDVRFIRRLGFEPGKSVDELWGHYRKLRWSPWFHWTYFKARLVAQFGRGPIAQRLAVAGFWVGIVAATATFNLWLPVLLGWILPVGLMFQRAALEQFMGEHRWLRRHDPDEPDAIYYALTSAGRFALAEPPAEDLPPLDRAAAWGRWFLDLQFNKALYRPSIVFADLAHHDEHHVHGLAMLHDRGVELPRYTHPDVAWMNTAYGRRVYQRLRRHDDPQLQEFWNRNDPLQATFEVLSEMDPDLVGPPSEGDETANGMLGM